MASETEADAEDAERKLSDLPGWENLKLIDDFDAGEPVEIRLPHEYEPRFYQKPIWRAMFQASDDERMRRAVLVWHRRAGKDKTTINLVVAKAMERIGTYLYLLPKQNQARKVIWNGMDKEGFRFIDHIHPDLIARKNSTEMLVELINGSIIQVGGADNYDSWMGTNPIGIVFSEYSIQDPFAWEYFRPILVENDGWALFIYTPRGRNHGYILRNIARRRAQVDGSGWFFQELSYKQTGAVTEEQVQQEIEDGMSEQMAEQEFGVSFDAYNEGAIYGPQIRKAWEEDRIGFWPLVEGHPVHTVQDIGHSDSNSIWFFQVFHDQIRLVHFYENFNRNMGHYIKYIRDWADSNGATLGEWWAPHDIEVHEWGSGDADGMAQTRREMALSKYGVDFKVVPKIPLHDGIEAGRALFPKIVIHEAECVAGLACLTEYEYEYDEKKKVYKTTPLHNWASNGADAYRYLAVISRDMILRARRREGDGRHYSQTGALNQPWSPFD